VTAKAISHRVSKLRAIAAGEDAETTSKTSGARAKGRAKGARVVDGKKRTSNGSCKVPSLVEGGEGSSVGKGNGAVKTEDGLGALEEARMGKRVKIVDGRSVVDRAGSDGHEEDGDPEIGGAVKSEGAGERLEDQIAREMGAAVETV